MFSVHLDLKQHITEFATLRKCVNLIVLTDTCDVCLAVVILSLGEVLEVGDGSLAGVVLRLGKVLQVGNFVLASVILALGPAVKCLQCQALLPRDHRKSN